MSPSSADRPPPQSRVAEQGVLSAILRDQQCVEDVTEVLTAEDFYFDVHQKIFRAITDQWQAGAPCDLVILHDVLKRRQQLEDVGGDSYLAELWDAVPTGANAVYHAGIVRDAKVRRDVIHLATEAARNAYDGAAPGDEIVAAFETSLHGLATRGRRDPVVQMSELVAAEMNRIADLGTGRRPTGIPTGFHRLDEMTGGFREGLYVVGARPSVGKSALMLSLALTAVRHGTTPLIFSLEMPHEMLCQRHLSMLSGVNLRRLRGDTQLRQEEIEALVPAAGELAAMPILVSDTMEQTPRQIMATARRARRRRGVGIVFVDYLQIVEPEDRRASRVEQLGTISRRMKQLARQAGLPVVCLAQLNRGAQDRGQEEPRLSDFKGSGDIEQDADDCYLLWPEKAEHGEDVWQIGLVVAKQRNGPTGKISLDYRRSCTRFEDPLPY